MFVFTTFHRRFTFVHLSYTYLIRPTGLFPQPFNTSWSPSQHRGAVCWPACTLPAEGQTSILFTAPKQNLSISFRSGHKLVPNVPAIRVVCLPAVVRRGTQAMCLSSCESSLQFRFLPHILAYQAKGCVEISFLNSA